MQDLLTGLDPTIVIILIVAGLLALVAVVLLVRRLRNRQAPPDETVAPTLGGPIDYTSLPLDEEPRGWRERFARLSMPGKILALLVPILGVLGLVALVLTLLPSAPPPPPVPTPIPVTLSIADAAVIRADPLTIDISAATTGLPDGAEIVAELLEDGEPFAYLDPDQARGEVRRNRVEIQAQPAASAPRPSEGRTYTVIVRADGGTTSEPAELVVPDISGIADAFFDRQAVVPPTATPAPTNTPVAEATPEPTPEPTAEPTAAAELPTGPAASVSNGGNVRRLPIVTADNVIGGINAGEQVQLVQRTPNGQWYRVRTVRDDVGWVSASLLSVPQGSTVPVAPVVTVFVNGAVYERPDSASTEVDRVNRDEVVELTQRTASGDWYAVNNVRGISGWVPSSLLGIPPEVAAAVPVAP